MREDLWVIEARNPDGSLSLTQPQPEKFFGMGAIQGMTDNAMAKVIFRIKGEDVVLSGMSIPIWPANIDARFAARRKTW